MKRVLALCLVLLLCATASGGSFAQDEAADVLVIASYGDWWASLEGRYAEPFLVDFCGTSAHGETQVGPMVMSPDGDYVAYLTLPLAVSEMMEASGGIGGTVASQVRLCDGIESVDILLPSQPDNFNFAEEGLTFYHNSSPSWSPDGQSLAWSAWRYPEDDFVLVIFSATSGQMTTIEGVIPSQYGIPMGLQTLWGRSGIALVSYTYDFDTQVEQNSILLFDTSGNLITEHVNETYADDYLWVDDNGQEKLALVYPNSLVELWEPTGNTLETLAGRLEYYAAEAANPTYRLTYEYISYNTTNWVVWDAAGNQVAQLPYIGNSSAQGIAVAGSTQSIAYLADHIAWVWNNGTTESVLIPTGPDGLSYDANLIWAPMQWRVWR